jgi:hypothetical protein
VLTRTSAHLRRIGVVALAMVCASRASAQAAPPRTRADSLKADSARIADSLAIVRELEAAARTRPAAAPEGAQGPTNPRLLPDISVVGDLVGDLSPKSSTQEDNSRVGVREVELGVQAAVDPYFRGVVYLGISDLEGISVEQAFLTATSLPWQVEARLGRMLAPVGKQNTTHRHDLHTIEYPWVLQRFLGPEGLKGTGVYLSRVFSPLGFYQEVILGAVDRFGEAPDDLTAEEPANKRLSGVGYSARLRNYWDLSQSGNLEISASAITGRREQPVSGASAGVNAANARQTVVGLDVTYRWRPLRQGLYQSFILQFEALGQRNEADPALPEPATGEVTQYDGPVRGYNGWYAFARWQMGRRWYVGGRVDGVEDPDAGGGTLRAASGYWEFFPSEFSKLVAGYERVKPPGGTAVNRLILQATFALGPHRPHPF